MMKKLVSMLLALLLALSACGVAAVAEEVTLPRFQYRSNDYVAYLGKELYIEMKVLSAGKLPADAVIELRDETGKVWSEKTFKASAQNIGFHIPIEEEHLGRHALNVWYGEERITKDDLRVYVADRSLKSVKKVETDQPYMAITLDCGYEAKNTDMVLKVLEDYGIKVTFFFTGYFVKNFPESAAKIRDAGHEIGCHSMWHPHLTQEDRATQVLEIQYASEYIQEHVGVVPRVFRPPFGDVDSAVMAISRCAGMEVIMWTIDSHDWDTSYNAEKIYKRVTKDITPGTIILFHLDGAHCEENLRNSLNYYINELGLQVVPVTKLLEVGGMELPPCPYVTEETSTATEL